jgi:hypothetical protein
MYVRLYLQLDERRGSGHLQLTLKRLGPLQSVTFEGVGADGSDLYVVKFGMKNTEWEILIGVDGNLEKVAFQPLD